MKYIKSFLLFVLVTGTIIAGMFAPDFFFRYVDYKNLNNQTAVFDNDGINLIEKETTLIDKLKTVNSSVSEVKISVDDNEKELIFEKFLKSLGNNAALYDFIGLGKIKIEFDYLEITKYIYIPTDTNISSYTVYKINVGYPPAKIEVLFDEKSEVILEMEVGIDYKNDLYAGKDLKEITYAIMSGCYTDYKIAGVEEEYNDIYDVVDEQIYDGGDEKKPKSYEFIFKYLIYNDYESYEYQVKFSDSSIIFNYR